MIPLDLPPSSEAARLLSLVRDRLPQLGLSSGPAPVHELVKELEKIDDEALLGGPARDANLAACVRSGLLLRGDFFDLSHDICQSIETPEGSYWHGILHRREPDDSNARYWFHRVGAHEIFGALPERAERELGRPLPERLLDAGRWSSFQFIELCSEARDDRSAPHEGLLRLQEIEIECLLGYCASRAIAST